MDRLTLVDEWTIPIARFVQGEFALVDRREPVGHARLLMRMKDVSCLLVLGDDGPTGVLWARDVGPNEDALRVEDVMRPRVPSLPPYTPAREALEVLRESAAGCAAVVEGGRVIGMVTSADVVRRMMDGASAPMGK